MAISRLTLAAIMVLGLGLSTLSGPAMAAPVNPIVAFNDFYRRQQTHRVSLGRIGRRPVAQARGRGRVNPGRRAVIASTP